MAGRIPQSFIQELLARIDIVEVVQRYVPLKKAGANYQACCPFHSEKSPSFTVSPTKQFYHCFGCGAHGSAVGFVMEHQGLNYPEAIEELARQAGMQVPREALSPTQTQQRAQSASLTELMARAAAFYRAQLKSSPQAIDYLKRRGLTGEVAARFGVGYAPEGWQSLKPVFEDYDAAALAECGLVIDADAQEGQSRRRRYDRFRDRIMFPIQNTRGAVIGFGGRVLDKGEPKYLNSPETPLFSKGRELYGLPQARAGIRDQGFVLVVEGYMDVVALNQFGIDNAVATLGTATTADHVKLLFRQTDRIVFCFDGDKAGRKAAWRALEGALPETEDKRHLQFLFLPEEHDPDSYVRAHGAEAFRTLARQSGDAADFLIQELRQRHRDARTIEGAARLYDDARPLLAGMKARLLRGRLAREVMALTGSIANSSRQAEQELGLQRLAGDNETRRHANTAPAPRKAPQSIASRLLQLVMLQPALAQRVGNELLEPDDPALQAITAILDAFDHGDIGGGPTALMIEHFRDTEVHWVMLEAEKALELSRPDPAALEEEFLDALRQLRKNRLKRAVEALTQKERMQGLTPEERTTLKQILMERQSLERAGRQP